MTLVGGKTSVKVFAATEKGLTAIKSGTDLELRRGEVWPRFLNNTQHSHCRLLEARNALIPCIHTLGSETLYTHS